MSYSTQNLGSLMDDIGADESATGAGKAKRKRAESDTPFWKSQGFAAGLAVVAVIVLCTGIWFSFFTGGAPKPPSSVTLLDVKTGELYQTSTKRLMLPAKNPDSGERCLFPVFKDDEGEWRIGTHYQGAVAGIEFNPQVVLDLDSGRINATDSRPKKLPR